ncbi:MAG: polymer-forming cytoskeletal protein [Candidatus Omnitrophota bacterium]
MPKLMGKRNKVIEEKVLDVDASMQGTLVFKDPVNLRINGNFEGALNTRGSLTISHSAVVKAEIVGDDITIAGTVIGNITAKTKLKVIAPAHITGDMQAPVLSIAEGAIFHGRCQMNSSSGNIDVASKILNLNEVANYLEVTTAVVNEWASQGKIPARRENDNWQFDKAIIDEWISKERVK